MTTQARYPKRLIEVDLPIKRISEHARREKSIRHGHISTLHIWWARRPLAACRAVICAALWPDPADPLCPDSFRKTARSLMQKWAKENLRLLGPESYQHFVAFQRDPKKLSDDTELRRALLDLIADFSNWDNSTVKEYLDTSRTLTQSAHEAFDGAPRTKPLVADPFAGGGAIPIEALRVGADAYASDLNPVPVLLNKVMLQYLPKYRLQLAEEVRKWGDWIRKEAESELREFFPKDPDGSIPIAYLWARTIRCEGPNCGAEIPLIKSLWLGKKPHNTWSLRIVPNVKKRLVEFEIVRSAKLSASLEGTVKRGSATCPCCGYTTPSGSVRKQLIARRGGASDARLFCVVTVRPGDKGRYYREPVSRDLSAVSKAVSKLVALEKRGSSSKLTIAPNEPTPVGGGKGAGRAFSQRNYGMDRFVDLFTQRQILLLTTLIDKLKEARKRFEINIPSEFADAVQSVLALNIDKMSDYNSSLASWSSPASQETVRGTFSRQALQIVWDFAEAYPFASSSGGWNHNLGFLTSPLEAEANTSPTEGEAALFSATNHPLPDDTVDAFITDPPYYDAIPYADLSDYFIVWLKRSLEELPFAAELNGLSPKEEECVVDEVKGHDSVFFEQTMRRALFEGRRITKPGGIAVVVFAHKSTQGWEAQLQALVDAGWIVTGSWPIDTEREGRVRANSSAALASSVHLVCRPRENLDGLIRMDDLGDWRDVLRELPKRIHEWMPRLNAEGIVGADAIFACLGPALEVFSRYSRVEKASGEQVLLKEYLEQVWAAVAKEALNMIFKGADATGFEEDARITAMWLWTLSTSGNGKKKNEAVESDEDDEEDEKPKKTATAGYFLEYDAARKIAQGLGAHLEDLASVVEVKGDKARLLPVSERTRHLFGKDETEAPEKRKKKQPQMALFETIEDIESDAGKWGAKNVPKLGNTSLDRIHQSMILFAAGRSEALKRFLVEEGVGKDARFWRLAQALSALYPSDSDEKRWVDGVLARKKSLGF